MSGSTLMRGPKGVRSWSVQSGMSLIELMVSVAISLLMMIAILQLYLDLTRTNDEMAKTNAQIENGRFSIQLLQDEIAHAGYWGGHVPQYDDLTASDTVAGTPPLVQGTPRAVPSPCGAASSWTTDDIKDALLGVPVQVFDAEVTGCSMPDHVTGTDVLVVRHAALATGCDVTDTCVQNTFCGDEMPGYRLDVGPTNSLHLRDCVTSSGAMARRYVSNIYYVKNIGGTPTLMRLEFGAASAQPLIEGVEGFRVELGIDNVSKTEAAVDYSAAVDFAGGSEDRTDPTNRGDGVPDVFVRCPSGGCSVEQLRDAVAVKVFVLVRNLQETSKYQDPKQYCLESMDLDPDADCSAEALFQPDADEQKFKRHLFSATVRLVNVASRRETP